MRAKLNLKMKLLDVLMNRFDEHLLSFYVPASVVQAAVFRLTCPRSANGTRNILKETIQQFTSGKTQKKTGTERWSVGHSHFRRIVTVSWA